MSLKAVFTSASNLKQFTLSRGKDIPGEVLRGEADVGFCGDDVYQEARANGLCGSLGFVAVSSMDCQLVLGSLEKRVQNELRVATSFPTLARNLLEARGYVVSCVQEFGGKVEGKLAGGIYNAIVDIRQTGKTMEDNGIIVRDVLLEDMKTGIIFRNEPLVNEDNKYTRKEKPRTR